MDLHDAGPPPLVPDWIAHVRVRDHVHVVTGHQDHREFLFYNPCQAFVDDLLCFFNNPVDDLSYRRNVINQSDTLSDAYNALVHNAVLQHRLSPGSGR